VPLHRRHQGDAQQLSLQRGSPPIVITGLDPVMTRSGARLATRLLLGVAYVSTYRAGTDDDD
jgi:hypothetical protein